MQGESETSVGLTLGIKPRGTCLELFVEQAHCHGLSVVDTRRHSGKRISIQTLARVSNDYV